MLTQFARSCLLGGLLASLPARAVYAPIPEQDQGKEFVVSVRAGISHDSNIFGSPTGEISSMVYEFSPKFSFNSSLTDQTFLSAAYELTLDYFDNRPGDKSLDSHDLSLTLDHSFSPVTTLHLGEEYAIQRNPASLLNGVTINTDQSLKRNVLDGRFETHVTPMLGVGVKFQSVNYAYDDNTLATELDHNENLYGLSLSSDVRSDLKATGELRHSDILYSTGGATKNKHSDFVIGGLDYAVAKQLTASGRLGYEWRQRDGDNDTSAPYVQLSLKYDYGQQSFYSVGYVYTFEENSDIVHYSDTKVTRFFFNVQHAFSPVLIASGSLDYEPSQLQGRLGLPNKDETTTRVGLALTYLAAKNWRITASYDHDNIDSDDPSRGQERERAGLSAAYSF